MYQIRLAVVSDLPRILEIYAAARNFMRKTGNPTQWAGGHPSENLLQEDMEKDNLYVVTDDAGIHGVFAFIPGEDPTYRRIEDGAWHRDDDYAAIHRVAGDGSGGIFGAIVSYCRGRCSHLRIDTHHDNRVMQHVVQKHGFRRCGIIYLANGDPRIAYDLT